MPKTIRRLNIRLRPEEACILDAALRSTWERPAEFARVAVLERAERLTRERDGQNLTVKSAA